MPERVLIASAIYPQPDDVARDFAASLAASAVQDPDIGVLYAVESGTPLDPFLPNPANALSVEIHQAEPSVTGPALRQVMVDRAASRSDCAIVAFLDCDDRIRPNAPALYRSALAGADIAYGDMQLIDRAGSELTDTLYGGCNVPNTIADSSGLARRNPLGLSNSAVRRRVLEDAGLRIPPEITAVDWWLFTMLIDGGATAKKTTEIVADYRQYAENMLGKKAIANLQDLRTRLTIAEQHHKALPKNDNRQRALDLLTECRATMAQSPDTVEHALRRNAGSTLWHENTFRVAASIQASNPGGAGAPAGR